MSDNLKGIRDALRQFSEHFAAWRIAIPAEDARQRRAGVIEKHNWIVRYAFGRDERGEFLDFESSHRMDDGARMRLRAGERPESFGGVAYVHVERPGNPLYGRRWAAAMRAHNIAFHENLRRRGFLLADLHAPPPPPLTEEERELLPPGGLRDPYFINAPRTPE